MQQLEDLERERTEEVSRLKGATLPPCVSASVNVSVSVSARKRKRKSVSCVCRMPGGGGAACRRGSANPGLTPLCVRVSSSLSGPVDPSFRSLSRCLKFTVRRLKFNKGSLHEFGLDSLVCAESLAEAEQRADAALHTRT